VSERAQKCSENLEPVESTQLSTAHRQSCGQPRGENFCLQNLPAVPQQIV